MRYIILLIVIAMLNSCNQKEAVETKDKLQTVKVNNSNNNNKFNDYWYAGEAEVSSYELDQARYGEMRKGDAVLIFVTEPFSKEKQVKLDNPSQAGDDKQTVMKLNFTKKFKTGIYPYSMMQSTFTPVDRYNYPNTVKTTMSSQEWCGHVFTQVNLEKNKYDIESFSYFESEGDEKYSVDKVMLEDEIWNLIRLDYEALPTGKISMLPGIFATRLNHNELKPMKVNAKLKDSSDMRSYSLSYENGRTLTIDFEKSFPHKILGWQETYEGLGGEELATTGELKETLLIDYWSKNSNGYSYLRDSLKLQ